MDRQFTEAEAQACIAAEPKLRELGLVVDREEGLQAEYDHNTAALVAFFKANPSYPVTVDSIVKAVIEYIPGLKWKTPERIVFDKLRLTQQESDVLFSVIARRDLDPNFALENATAIAEWIKNSGRGIGPQSIDLAIGNIPNTPAGARKLHWKRRLQDNEKRELERREAERKALEENRKTRKEQASIEVHPELRLSERAKAHRDMMNRQPQKVQMTESTPPTDYWKGRCESAIATLPVMDRGEAQQIMDHQQGGSYQTAHMFIMTFVNRRAHERANAASLARMGR